MAGNKFQAAVAVTQFMDQYVAPAVLVWFTAQWFGSTKPAAPNAKALTQEERAERATVAGASLGIIIGACGIGAVSWVVRWLIPWKGWQHAPGIDPVDVCLWSIGGLTMGFVSAWARAKVKDPLGRAFVMAVGTAFGIAATAFYLVIGDWIHKAMLCAIMAILVGQVAYRVVEVRK